MAIGCLALFSMPSSSAHVEIVSSYPEQFSNVNPIPTEVWITSSGELQTLEDEVLNTLEVIDSTNLAMNIGDPVIEGAKIMTKISEQSAPGVFTVKYRVVGDDGHVIEGDYTFNASPDYAEAVPTTTSEVEQKSSLNIGGIVLVIFLIIFIVGYIIKERNDKK
jgi:methionine-rich copper-binding protein CopC